MPTSSALSPPGDSLLDKAAAKVGVDQSALGSPNRFTKYRVRYFFAPGKPGESLGLESLHELT